MNPLKILTVDDDPFTLNMLKKKLEKEGYDIETAKDGIEACKFISEFEIKKVITNKNIEQGKRIDKVRRMVC